MELNINLSATVTGAQCYSTMLPKGKKKKSNFMWFYNTREIDKRKVNLGGI